MPEGIGIPVLYHVPERTAFRGRGRRRVRGRKNLHRLTRAALRKRAAPRPSQYVKAAETTKAETRNPSFVSVFVSFVIFPYCRFFLRCADGATHWPFIRPALCTLSPGQGYNAYMGRPDCRRDNSDPPSGHTETSAIAGLHPLYCRRPSA